MLIYSADGVDLRHAGNDYKGGLYAGKALAFRCVKKAAGAAKGSAEQAM